MSGSVGIASFGDQELETSAVCSICAAHRFAALFIVLNLPALGGSYQRKGWMERTCKGHLEHISGSGNVLIIKATKVCKLTVVHAKLSGNGVHFIHKQAVVHARDISEPWTLGERDGSH